MSWKRPFYLSVFLVGWSVFAGIASAQLQPQEPDPLSRIRAAAGAQSQACTIKEPSACAEATPKIVANALSSPNLAENIRDLAGHGAGHAALQSVDGAVAWAQAAFRDAGVDEVHTEELDWGMPYAVNGGSAPVNVVAEIRGREKPNEFVVLAAPLTLGSRDVCNTALIIEAARDIHLTGLRPLRSIRFVLFAIDQGQNGSRAYAYTHRSELDHVIAAAIFERGCGQLTGFSLGGRQDTEAGLRETFAVAPVDSWHLGNDTYDAPWGFDTFDFLLEGVATLLPNRAPQASAENPDLDVLRHNAAIAGVLAFALAEHPDPLGPRQSRAEIAALLEKRGLEAEMKMAGVWPLWENGTRGSLP